MIYIYAQMAMGILFLAGLFLVLASISIFGSSDNFKAIMGIILILAALIMSGWINCRSIKKSIFAVLTGLFVGLPVAFFVVIPISEKVWNLFPDLISITRYGPFNYLWYLLMLIIPMSLITGKWRNKNNWLWMFIGTLVAVSGVLIEELLTFQLGQNSDMSMIKIVFYTIWIWFWITWGGNYRTDKKMQNNRTN